MKYSAGQSQSTRQGQVGRQISSPEPGSTGQSQPERTTLANKNELDTHTCLFGQWKKLRTSIVTVQWFLFRKREISCPGTCAVPFFYLGSLPPPCHPIKKTSSPQLLCSLYPTSSQAKFLLMLSGHWQHACSCGYLRCLGSFSYLVGNVRYCVTCIRLLLQYPALKWGYKTCHAFWVVYTAKSWIVMCSVRFVQGTEIIGNTAVLAR